MGIVLKQTFKGAIYSYIGVILGGINVAILFPIIFSEEQIGLINILITVSAISAQFASLGAAGVINFFFPKFRNKAQSHNQFFVFISLCASIGFAIFTIVYLFWGDHFLATKATDTALQTQYSHLIYPLTFFTLAFIIVDTFCASTLNAVIGFFFKEIILRIVILIISLLVYFNLINFSTFISIYVLNMATPVLAILISMKKTGDISFRLPRWKIYQPHFRKMFSVGLFYIATGLSNILATYLDKFMINYFIGLKSTGIYSITNYFGSLVRIPRSSMGKIATPLIAKAIEENDKKTLSMFFEKSSISQVLFGILIFILIWVNIDPILSVLPPSYSTGKWVVFFISLSYIINCFLGVGGLIVSVSKNYKYSTLLTITLGLLIIVFNLIFIPRYGIVGAAAATALAKLGFVAIYLFFLSSKMNLKVAHWGYLKILVSGFIAYYISSIIPFLDIWDNPILNAGTTIMARSASTLCLFILSLLLTRFIRGIENYKKYL